MAKTVDELIKKYTDISSKMTGVEIKPKQTTSTKSTTKTTTTSNKGKQNKSASPVDDLINKYKKTSATIVKQNSLSGNAPFRTNTTKKYSDYNTDTKNAYTSVKDRMNSKTTIGSNLTDDERNKRIKEIKSELTTLNTKLSGYSRAKAYGTSKAMLEAEENDKKRMAELSQELKTLERVGTFSASELKQFEIDDAKARESSARQKVNSFGQRPTADNAEAYRQANSELFKAQEELKKLGVKSTGEKFLDSAGYAGEKLGRGVIDGLEGITDLAWSLVGATGWGITSGFGLFENDVSRAINKWYNDINNNDITDLFGSAEERYDATPKWVKDAGWLPETIGNIVPFAVETYLSGGTTAYDDLYSAGKSAWDVGRKFLSNPDIHFGMSAGGNAVETAIEKGANPITATAYGTAAGALEAATEKLFGGFAGLGDDFGKAGVKAFKNATGTTNQTLLKKIWNSPVTRKLLDIGTEGIEEDIVTFADPILQRATGVDSNAKWASWNDYVESGTHGVILSVVMNAVGIPISKYNKSRAISSLNHSAEILNGLTQDEAVKLQPLPNNATEEEIIARQKEVSAVALAFNNAVKKAVQTEQQTSTPDPLEQTAREVVEERNRIDGLELLEARKNGNVTPQMLERLSQVNAEITNEEAKKATGFGDKGAELVAKAVNTDGATFYQTVAEVKPSYLAGFNNPDMDIKDASYAFKDPIHQEAFSRGQQDAVMQNSVAKEKAKSATVYDGAFTENEYTKKWSEATKKMVSTVAKHFGMDISVVDKIIASRTVENGVVTEHEANASHNDGKMEISNNKTAEKLIHALVMHESGHRMEQFATDEWNELCSFLYERAERLGRRIELGVSQGMLFDAVKAEHDEAGISLSTKGYIGEIAVRELETIFSSPEEFNSFISEIESNPQAKSAWGKFVQWLSELIEDLKRAWSQRKMTAEEKASLKELERIKELYAKAYLATRGAVAERAKEQSADTKSSKNLEIKINEEYNGNGNYSIKSKYNEYNTIGMQWAYSSSTQIGDKKVLYNPYKKKYVLAEATKDDLGFIELKSGTYKQMREDEKFYESNKQGEFSDDERAIDKAIHNFEVRQNDNTWDNVDVGNKGTGIQNAEVSKGKSKSNRTTDTRTTDGDLTKKNYSLKTKAPTFYSQMAKTIDGIKQDKIGANSVVSYLTGRGVKAEEIKWSGIETFLEGKKSVTKAELQEFVAGSMLQIETKTLTEKPTIDYTEDESNSLAGLSELYNEYWEKIDKLWMDKYGEEIAWDVRFNDNAEDSLRLEMRKLQRDDAGSSDFFNEVYKILGNIRTVKHNEDAIIRRATERTNTKKGNLKTKYEQYTLDGGSNYRELLFKLPNSEYTNESMSYHWGEEGILAHARIQDFDVDGQKMLFIEEIQSDWHNEGQKRGYQNKLTPANEKAVADLREKQVQKHNELKEVLDAMDDISSNSDLWDKAIKLRNEEQAIWKEIQKLKGIGDVTDAPFRNNYHEYVLKNLLRMAAEDGYDSIGWTTADIQSDRWSDEFAEGYRIEYDQDIPKFLNKYGKKWGAKVGTTVIGREEGHWEDKARWVEKEGTEVWSMPITDSMKDSVLYEGQPMFSLKKAVEQTKNLIAVHNSTEEKLIQAIKLGGLPSPSIAITKNDVSHEKFGDISLVFRKSTISPTDRRNKIYSGDAYTPTGVRVEYDVDDDILQDFNKRLKELTPEWSKERLPSVDSGTAEVENDSLYTAYERNDRAKFAFLREKGKAPKIAMRTPRLSTFVSNDTVIALAKAFTVKQLSDIANTSDGVKQYKNAFLKVIRDNEDSRAVESGIYSADEASLFDIAETARVAKQVKENKYKIAKAIDLRNTFELIDKKFTKALKAEYKAWIDENTKDAIIDKGIRNNRDLFTPSGNRRSFKQLHDPYTLSNIVKQMFSGEDKGIALFGGSPIGAAQHEYSSIDEVKADSGRIQQLEQEEYDRIRNDIEGDINELANKMKIRSDIFAVRDLLAEAIGKKTKQQADSHLKRESEGWANYSPEFTNELWDIRGRILNMPTEYFESKPQRAVSFNEVALAVLPKGKTALRKMLEDAGVQKVVYYDKTKDGDRLAKVNSAPDINFSLKGTNNTNLKERKELLDIIEHLKGEFEITKFAKADPKKLAKMTREILKEYDSKADYDETYYAIDELYKYMANGEGGNVAWEEVYNRAYNIARTIAQNALVVDDTMYQEYRHLREYLRTTPIKFTAYDSVPSGYENFNDFRRHNMGRLNFTKDGMGIDAVYQELAHLYPEFFDAEEQINSADQLERIIDVLDELQPMEINPFDSQIEKVSMQIANDLTNRFFDIPQAKPTFADKAERRVVEAHIKGGKKVEAVRQQKDAKIKKLIEAQREKTKKQLDKIRQQRDTKVEKEKEKRQNAISKMSESQKVRELRAKIIRHTGELNKTLLKATDKKHIPPELENAVVALLYNINMESNYSYDVETRSYKKNDEGLPTNKTKAFRDLKEVYEAIAKNNDYGLTIASELFDATGEGVSNIFDDVMKLSDKKIADMTSQELTLIYDTIRLVEHSIATANKMFAMQKWEGLTETAKAFEKSVATRRAKNPLRTNYTIDIETPITFFSHFGEAGLELYEALRVAQDNGQMMIDEITEIVEGVVSLEDVQKANKEIHEFTTVGGKKLTLSKAHIMDIYLLYNRNQGKKHLLYDPDSEYFGKGIRQPEIKNKKIGRGTENIRLTKTDIGNIISTLSEQDKAIADKMQKATLKLAEWGNKACMEVFGYEKFNDPDYWTIKSAPEGTNKSVEKNKNAERSIKNMGSAKQTDAKATNALEIGGIFDVFNQHASDMICYSSWLAVVEDATKLYNFTLRDEFGNKTDVTFQDLLNKYAGNGGSDYYFNLLSDIQNGIGTKPDTKIERIYTSLYGKAAKAKVMFKATVVAQQPMSIVRAMTVLKPTSIVQALGKGGVNLPAWAVGKAKNLVTKDAKASEWYGGWQRALKYAPIAARKAVGGYEINSNSSGLESVLYKPKTVKGKTIDALKESPLWAAGKADEVSWGILWNACEIETSKNTTLEKGSDAYYEAVAKLFSKVINETQVVDGVLQRSQIMRSSSGWIKPATAFKGEPIMALNTLIRAYDNLRYETNPSKRGKAIKSFSRATSVFVASAIFTAFARSLAVGVTGDDDEEYWKKVWKSFSGVQGDEDTWFDYVKNIGLKSDVVNNVNPLSWLPIASEMMSALQGYDVERLDVASIGEFVNASTTFINSLDAEGKNTVPYATRNLLLKFAELTGYSPYNLVRDIEGAIRTTRVETNDVRGLYDMEKWRTKPASNTSKYIDILYKAYSTDHEAYEDIYNDMIENGVDAKKIKSGMETRMKKAEGVTEASELSKRYMTPDDEEKYDSSLSRMKSSQAWKSATSTQKKNAEADLYKFLTSTSDDVVKAREEARQYGVDETEYALWQLAIEMADQPKGAEGSGSYSAKEKAEAINLLDFDDEEIAYFFGKGLNDSAKEELNETLNAGIDMQEYVNFKAAVNDMKADKNAKGKSIPNSKKKKVVRYLNSAGLTDEEWDYFYYEIMNYKK